MTNYTYSPDLSSAKRLLARHRAASANRYLQRALERCPADNNRLRAEILYYAGISLMKQGLPGRAIAHWVEAQRLDKHSYAAKMLRRCTNDYGMPKQESREEDDRQAFASIQLSRYLSNKKSRRLDTRAETDMIGELIDDYWRQLRDSGVLEGKTADERIRLFRKVVVVFPFIELPDRLDDGVVHVDFDRKRRLFPADRCACGSGLEFKLCCGRTPGEDELLSGQF